MSDRHERDFIRWLAEVERGTWREQLRADYPLWFDQLGFGFQCNDGWRDLVVALTAEIAALVGGPDTNPQIRVVQVKEKWGTLRYYVRHVPEPFAEAVQAAVFAAEERSARICEICGEPGRLRETEEGFWYAACDVHAGHYTSP